MAHSIEHFDDVPFQNWARCRCGFTTKKCRTRQEAEDDVNKHWQEVERVRLHLGTRNPSLQSQRDYYRQMAEDENVTPHDRRLWAILADELDRRVGSPVTDADQPTLI